MPTKKSTWDPKVAKVYRYMPPPGPPSKSELKVYEKFVKPLKNKRGARVLVLGSTPGLRDLCLKYKMRHLCVDHYKDNFYIAKTVLKYKGKENLLVSDWRKMKLKDKYDLVLGDIAFPMVPYRDWDKLFSSLQKSLKDDGLIVHRTWMRKKGHFKNLAHYLKYVHPKRRKKIHPYTSLLIPFMCYFYNEKKEEILFSQNLNKLEKFVKNGSLPQKDLDYMHLFLDDYKHPSSYPLKPKCENKLKQYFKIKKILKGKDWFRDYALIYVLAKK